MFTGWKGKKPGSQQEGGTFPTPGGGGVGGTSSLHLNTSGISYSSSYPSPHSPTGVGGVFGAPINPSSEGPPLLGKLIRFLQTKTATGENLFLPPAEIENEVQVVKKNILRDMATNPTANDDALQLSSYTKNPLVIAELLRLFLAALPEPLLTYQLYDSFLLTQTIQSPADRVWAYRFLLAYLPPGFRSSVKQLLTLLFNLSRNSEENGMDAQSLACVFGPYFLRAEEDLYYMRDDPPLVVQIVALLIQEYESVLRAAPAAPPSRSLPAAIQPVSSFPIAPTSPTRHDPVSLPQMAHPLDQSVQQPASLYTQENPKSAIVPRSGSGRSLASRPPPPALSGLPPPPTTKFSHTPSTTSSSTPSSTSSLVTSGSGKSIAVAQNPASPAHTSTAPASANASPAHASTAPASSVLSPPAPAASRPPSQQMPAFSPSSTTSPLRSESPPPRADDETLGKLGKLRDNVLNLLDDQISTSVMSLLSAIMAATTPGEALDVSRALLVIKKFLTDQVNTSLKVDKMSISAYLADKTKPPLSLPPPAAVDDPQLNKLRVAAYQATEQFMELLFYLSSRMSDMTQPDDLQDAIAIAQVAKALKSNTAEQLQRLHFPPLSSTPLSTPSTTPSTTPSSTPLSTPVSAPSTPFNAMTPPGSPGIHATPPSSANTSSTNLRYQLQRSGLNTSSSSLPTLQASSPEPPTTPVRQIATSREGFMSSISREVVTSKQSLENILVALQNCGQSELVECAKGVRFAKQIIGERVADLALGIDMDARVEAMEGEDPLSALRRACGSNVAKLIELLDAINIHVHSPGGQQMDPRPIAEAISVVSRALGKTCESIKAY